MMKNHLLFAALALTVAACSASYKPMHYYSEILVVNNSREALENVTIDAPGIGRSLDCGYISPLGICSNRIGKRRYDGDPIRIDWEFGNTPSQSEEFVIEPPATFASSISMRAVLAVDAEGYMSAYFEQDSPLR